MMNIPSKGKSNFTRIMDIHEAQKLPRDEHDRRSSPTTSPNFTESLVSPWISDDNSEIASVQLTSRDSSISGCQDDSQAIKVVDLVDAAIKAIGKSDQLENILSIDQNYSPLDTEDVDLSGALSNVIKESPKVGCYDDSSDDFDEKEEKSNAFEGSKEESESLSTNILTNFKIDRDRDVVKNLQNIENVICWS